LRAIVIRPAGSREESSLMLCNAMGSSGVKISAISFGAMRWPSEEACHAIMNRGLDLGLNYVDTSTGYVGGQSEKWTARAIKDRREEICFSAKSSFGEAPSADEVREAIDRSLQATGLDYFDFYQMWGLQTTEVLQQALAKGGTVEGVRKAQKEGLIRHGLGFTFHGPAETFRAAIDTGEFLCATVSYNLMNRKEEEQIAYAGAHGVGVIIMNPLAGGVLALAGHPALDFLRDGDGGPGCGALRFLLANKNITTSIVGFRAVEEVDQAVLALDGARTLDERYRQGLIEKMDAVKLLEGEFCTGCGYCKECPNGVNPQKLMQAMRDFAVYGVEEGRLDEWIWSKYPHQDPVEQLALCTECGECEEKCPQHLEIVEQVSKARAALSDGRDSRG
jgi:predicted aldo/keto reductase-like oxidoreductase